MDASSVAHGECSTYNWGYNISTEEMLYQIFDGGDELLQQDFRSMAQTSYLESSMPQHLRNSQGDGHGALSSEPDPTHQDLVEEGLNEPRVTQVEVENVNSQLDQAGTPSQACNGKKRKEPERIHKKREADRKYRADIKRELSQYRVMKPENDRLREVVSRFGGIDQLESQITHMNSELHRLRQKEGGIHEMESMLDNFKRQTPKDSS
ncbi:hypothetical protein V6N12_072433 [Hibiscus sabdariffa]|uniref:BHLH domain-containing protein n=1 Tax=Hibiscus sabdariffa TaxID=183260 RepID=A0ABR2FMR1_9ROSI